MCRWCLFKALDTRHCLWPFVPYFCALWRTYLLLWWRTQICHRDVFFYAGHIFYCWYVDVSAAHFLLLILISMQHFTRHWTWHACTLAGLQWLCVMVYGQNTQMVAVGYPPSMWRFIAVIVIYFIVFGRFLIHCILREFLLHLQRIDVRESCCTFNIDSRGHAGHLTGNIPAKMMISKTKVLPEYSIY